MALLKFLRRPASGAPASEAADLAKGKTPAADAVEAARQQARRRLIGAIILLGIGVIGFPLIFQTQPRPIPVDIPIDIPRRDGAPPLNAAAGGNPATMAAPATPATPAAPATPVEVEVLPPARSASGAEPASAASAGKGDTAKGSTDQGGTEKDRGRFIVQAGSYTDADTVRQVRSKLERMGLKTYTQAVTIAGVPRVRVRVGPYASKEEAQDVQNRIKAAGVEASLLQL